jgi:hypothetical protein
MHATSFFVLSISAITFAKLSKEDTESPCTVKLSEVASDEMVSRLAKVGPLRPCALLGARQATGPCKTRRASANHAPGQSYAAPDCQDLLIRLWASLAGIWLEGIGDEGCRTPSRLSSGVRHGEVREGYIATSWGLLVSRARFALSSSSTLCYPANTFQDPAESIANCTFAITQRTWHNPLPNTMCGILKTIWWETYELWDFFLGGVGSLYYKIVR